MVKEGATQEERLKQTCEMVLKLPLSGEVVYARCIEQVCTDTRKIAEIAPNIVVKIPGNMVGLSRITLLKKEGVKLNVTALMTFRQLALAAQQGADYISQFYCRGRDAGLDSSHEIIRAKQFIIRQNLKAKIIVGSLRSEKDLDEAIMTQGDILTITPELFGKGFQKYKTESTVDEFIRTYENLQRGQ